MAGEESWHNKESLCLCEWQSSTGMKWHNEAQERFVETILAVMAEALLDSEDAHGMNIHQAHSLWTGDQTCCPCDQLGSTSNYGQYIKFHTSSVRPWSPFLAHNWVLMFTFFTCDLVCRMASVGQEQLWATGWPLTLEASSTITVGP